MSSVSSSSAAREKRLQRQQLQNQYDHHRNELDKLQVKFEKKQNEVRNQQKVQLSSIQLNHQKKLLEMGHKNQESLEKLQSQLQQVKNLTDKEIEDIKNNHAQKLSEQRILFENKFKHEKEKNMNLLQEQDQEMRLSKNDIRDLHKDELYNLKRQSHEKLAGEKEVSKENLARMKENFEQTIADKKKIYEQKSLHQANTYQRKLRHQERQHLDDERKTKLQHDKVIQTLNKDHKVKKQERSLSFEKDFAHIKADHQKFLQALHKRHGAIINQLRNEISKEYRLGIQRQGDPFFQFTKIAPSIESHPEHRQYIIRVPLPRHLAPKLEMRAENRELRFSLQREYAIDTQNPNAKQNTSMKKVENYSTKIKVDEIINPKTITKTYRDNSVIFTIKYA